MRILPFSPAADHLDDFLDVQARKELSYPEVGASAGPFPAGYDHDHHRVLLGRGPDDLLAAREALRQWKMFALSWVRTFPRPAPLQEGTVVSVVFRMFGLYWLNSCRIVYLIHEPDRFGFAYGTLPGHVERGEERFIVEMDTEGQVWYRIEAFSRPGHWLTRLGYPLARRFQRRFVRDSFAAMQAAVQQKNTNAPTHHH